MPSVETTIDKVQHDLDSGWFTILDTEGKKFTTKIAEKASEAAGLKGQRVLLEFTEKVNTKDGRTYRNRYYERAGSIADTNGDGGIEQVGGEKDGAPTQGRSTPDKDAWRMCLNKGGELAVATVPMLPPDSQTFEAQKVIAYAWAEFFMFTPLPTAAGKTREVEQSFADPGGDYAPHNDDDIPF